MAKISFSRKEKSLKKLEKKIENLGKTISSFEEKIESIDSRIDKLIDSIEAGAAAPTAHPKLLRKRAKTEQFTERTERYERSLRKEGINRIRGRHREILAMLINNGFHTYKQIAEKLNISQSRARAYIAELKNKHKVPLRHVRDPEGYKVGIDARFIEEVILAK